MELITQSGVRRGDDHQTFCEDFLVYHETDNFHYGAVLDGCSSAVESHFASALFGKILKSCFIKRSTLINSGVMLEFLGIIGDFKKMLNDTAFNINLSKEELKSTIIISIFDKSCSQLLVANFGDGVIVVNGEKKILENTKYDNHNAPDYFVDDFFNKKSSEFIVYIFEEFKGYNIYKDVTDYTIASDGLLSFRSDSGFSPDDHKVIDFFALNNWNIENETIISKKTNLLKNGKGQKNGNPFEECVTNADDVSVIRVIKKQHEI